jgi:HEAT repeat protein
LLAGSFLVAQLFAQSGTPSNEISDEITEKNIKILQELFKDSNTKLSDEQFYKASQTIFTLTQNGTEKAVPELKKLLVYEELNTAARTALINIGDAGVAALRESLESLQGKNLAGVIESLASVRNAESETQLIKLTENSDPVIVKSAILALGKIASENAVKKLKTILSNNNSPFQQDAATAILCAAEQLLANNNSNNNADNNNSVNSAIEIFKELQKHPEFPAVWIAATQTYVLQDETNGLPILTALLTSDDETAFKTVCNIAVKMKSPQISKLILDNLQRFSGYKKSVLIEILGVRKEQSAVPELIKSATSEDAVVKIAAIKALGKIGDMRSIDTIFVAISSSDKTVADAGKESLAMLQGTEFNTVMIKNLDSNNKIFRLAALRVIEERRITEAVGKIRQLFNDSDIDVKVAAYRAFSQIIIATPADLEFLIDLFQKSGSISEAEKSGLQEALTTVCRKIPARDESVTVIEKFKNTGDTKNKQFLIDLLYLIGNLKACEAIVDFAKSTENEIADHATMLLGKWGSPEAAPFLIDLAENHPVEKYKIRMLSGYLRIIRQFGLPLEQKFAMIQKAETIAKRDIDKKRITEIKEDIQNQLKAQPIFDGKTFEGWEGNLSLFRIENGAIVGGTLEKPIPRNEFLCTKKEYGDFTLHLEIKILGKDGKEANAGVQFRSKRLTEDQKRPNEVSGYQADMTETEKFWGSLYDEARRNKFLAEANPNEIKTIFRPNDWNELKIVCKDNNIKLFVNGKMTVNYTENDDKIPKTGIIGLQIHGGNPSEAWYRNIRIEEL